ncbi:putative N6-adenine-specific DNA methylase [Albimonas donghaensis]|uniref:Putative N6-adenine-specific DNA methylase n=1 Tax=Albimonas donghaensis TaxID=356660 RepID=A0A1H3BPI9_9RHOB|nr:RNA methyltransferase [Albimonas donghaensis]SDX43618.1 putative N6-adenine-specific DNA methylase [Albimonas donghaensis]
MTEPLEIFLAAPPGLEPTLAAEAIAAGFADAAPQPGGVALSGDWATVRRANLLLRGAGRVLVRIGGFRAFHLAQLDKRSRKFPWGDFLRPDVPVRVEATCKGSRIYHARAAAQRVETALRESLGVEIAADAPIRLMVRIDDDFCGFSLDASGEPLHKRGHKEAVGKAPMRETLAALFLRACGHDGTEPLLDPMCGSGTFPIEAAEMAAGLPPGRTRPFAFELFAGHDPRAWAAEKAAALPASAPVSPPRFIGSDRDQGVIGMAKANAERAGVAASCLFIRRPISELVRPDGPPGLVIVNPPYGARIGEVAKLRPLYGTLGEALKAGFSGWRVGLITTETPLARATGLPFLPPGPPVAHGGLKVKLFRTEPLA